MLLKCFFGCISPENKSWPLTRCWLSTCCWRSSNLGVGCFCALLSVLLPPWLQDTQTTWCFLSFAGALMSWHHIWPRSMAATTLSQMRRGWVFGRVSLMLWSAVVCGWIVTVDMMETKRLKYTQVWFLLSLMSWMWKDKAFISYFS